jgi:hypothetical protein
MKALRHPLVYQVPYMDALAGTVNYMYEHKRIALNEKLSKGDYDGYVWLYERPWRLEKFLEVRESVTDTQYWEMLGQLWADCENIWQNGVLWSIALHLPRKNRERIMNKKERAALAKLCPVFTLYRGSCAPDKMGSGMSWTLNREQAEWFAQRFNQGGKRDMYLHTATVKRKDVIAYLTVRNENEIVVMPENLNDMRTEQL